MLHPRTVILRSHTFTLIEWLAVIAIPANLAATLLPTSSSANEKGKRFACLSNLRDAGRRGPQPTDCILQLCPLNHLHFEQP